MRGRLPGSCRPVRAAAAAHLKPTACLLLALGASAAAGQTAADRPVDVVPAWEGYYRPGQATELMLVARATGSSMLRSRVEDSQPPISMAVEVGPGETRLGVAIRPASHELTVVTTLDGSEPTGQALELVALSEPLIAIVADSTADLLPWLTANDDFRSLPVARVDLPRTAAGYEPLAGLALGRDIRAELVPAQRLALAAYLQGCGRVFAADAATAAALAATAGCSGRFVIRIETPDDMAAHVRSQVDALPRDAELRSLLRGPPRLIPIAAVFLGLYCLFVAVLAWRKSPGGWALPAAPVLASLLMLAVWLRDAPESRLLVWAEQQGQEPARYRAVLELYSQGTGPVDIPLETVLDLPRTLADGSAELAHGDGRQTLHWRPVLLGHLLLGVDGSVPVDAGLTIERPSAAGAAVAVRNRGAQTSAAAILAHERRYYRVPPLAPDESWAPGETTPTLSRRQIPAPLAAAGQTALLEPLRAAEFPAALPRADTETGWILRRADEALGR